MSSTYLSLYYHLVFSTKNRQPLIEATWRAQLHDYLGGTVNGLHGRSLCVGGTADHVHLLAALTATHQVADFMRDLKKASSSWVRENTTSALFAWQKGYAALTVSASGLPELKRYIQSQEKHHEKRSFRQEVLTLLKRSGVAVDERYFD